MALLKCPKRIVRNGVLIAFQGEYMSETEARRRGIYNDIVQVEKPADVAAEEVEEPAETEEPAEEVEEPAIDEMTVDQLRAYIKERGGDAPSSAKKAELAEIAKAL